MPSGGGEAAWSVAAVLAHEAFAVVVHGLGAVLLVLALAGLRVLHEAPRSRARRLGALAGDVVVAVAAFGALASALANRADTLTGALGRWDHWIFCALAGHLLSSLALATGTWAAVALSAVVVGSYVGSPALARTLLAGLAGWAAWRGWGARRPRLAVGAQVVAIGTLLAWLLDNRVRNPLPVLQTWGLACWALMRHASFLVEARRGASTRLRDYLCYLLFFPSCFGAMEVYDEFAGRNLVRRARPDLVGAVVGGVRADVLVRAGLLVPIDAPTWLAAHGFLELWARSLLLFLRGALFVAGLWSMIEADALLLGFRLRPNFTGVLTAENPSRFWRAWRGTMTNWLIRYVYIPLGGNRRHRTLNVLAAFAVSTAWHLGGVLFAAPWATTGMVFVPTAAWGALNFAGVAAHGGWRRRWPAGTWLPADAAATRLVKILLTLVFGSFTVTILGFPLHRVAEFPRVACTLAGLGAVCGR